MSGGEIHLPDGYTLHYPIGRSLDAQHRIQLESNEDLQGGVTHHARVPWTGELGVRSACRRGFALARGIDVSCWEEGGNSCARSDSTLRK
jgi:hypothetical protein